MIPLARWVAPFGDPGINDRSHLPRAFRSVPRPSSPLSAKASTRCPYFALLAPHPTANIIVRPGVAEATPLAEQRPARLQPPDAIRGEAGVHSDQSLTKPPSVRQTFSPGGTRVPPLEDTIGTHPAQAPWANNPSGPTDGSRLGHTTRLFTMSGQQRIPAGPSDPCGSKTSSGRVSALAPPAPAFGESSAFARRGRRNRWFRRWWR